MSQLLSFVGLYKTASIYLPGNQAIHQMSTHAILTPSGTFGQRQAALCWLDMWHRKTQT